MISIVQTTKDLERVTDTFVWFEMVESHLPSAWMTGSEVYLP